MKKRKFRKFKKKKEKSNKNASKHAGKKKKEEVIGAHVRADPWVSAAHSLCLGRDSGGLKDFAGKVRRCTFR